MAELVTLFLIGVLLLIAAVLVEGVYPLIRGIVRRYRVQQEFRDWGYRSEGRWR